MKKTLNEFYKGFWIEEPFGNNAFSYDQRINKKIFVPDFINGSLKDVKLGEQAVFSEIADGKEKNCAGLKHFVHWRLGRKDIFIFDNHNHAFFIWLWGQANGKIDGIDPLVHIDQHLDTRDPEIIFDQNLDQIDLQAAWNYTNKVLNVGNFVKPAIDLGLFSDVIMVNKKESFSEPVWPGRCLLDLDLDIFAPDMDYIPENTKIRVIKRYIEDSDFITVATSPYFIDQNLALEKLRVIFKDIQVDFGM
ncbi:MAG: UPF0489 family protein [Candidatus Omnitrophica bacterium]|nr:UPF0489 family protein [Candidatus Omnitrophota bacterium]